MSDKLELEKRCGNMVRGVGHHSECAGDVQKRFPNMFGKFKFSRFFVVFHPESQIHVRSSDLKGSKLIRKTRFGVLRSSQSAQGMCRNDPRTSLEKVIFWDFLKFSSFLALGLRSGSDPGIFEILEAPRQECTRQAHGYPRKFDFQSSFRKSTKTGYVL